MRLVILGPPGSGKGTQAKLLSKRLNFKHINTGDIFRREYKKKTAFGKKAFSYWGKGNLVPDEITIPFVQKILPTTNYVLDGYPRTINQAQALERYQSTTYIFYLNTSKKELIKRILNRAAIENRKDDTLTILKKRLDVYTKQTKPLLSFYKNKLLNINGSQDPEAILQEVLKAIKKHKKNTQSSVL
ncbi:MAG TPA: nucleoside monophosphate kinase [Candidatus Nanoarchaeia archaeon]|nr:nucleoside monophosphate kinase [Candidatus Nanoarchaeia archaeon]